MLGQGPVHGQRELQSSFRKWGTAYSVGHLPCEMNVGQNLFFADFGHHTIAHVDRSGLDLGDFPDGLDGVWESSSSLR